MNIFAFIYYWLNKKLVETSQGTWSTQVSLSSCKLLGSPSQPEPNLSLGPCNFQPKTMDLPQSVMACHGFIACCAVHICKLCNETYAKTKVSIKIIGCSPGRPLFGIYDLRFADLWPRLWTVGGFAARLKPFVNWSDSWPCVPQQFLDFVQLSAPDCLVWIRRWTLSCLEAMGLEYARASMENMQ